MVALPAQFCLAIIVPATLYWIYAAAQLLRLKSQIDRLGSGVDDGAGWPRISVIVAARNEEAAIVAAVSSLLAQDYPDFEVVAVDDRSSDGTGRILDELARGNPKLKVLHVAELPPGWLGKNHANDQGARRSDGDWLLFTDADAQFAASALRRAIAIAARHRLGHIVLLPDFITEGFWERAIVSTFGLFFSIRVRLWDLSRPRTKAYIGSGTFNLVRREDYQRSGGHEILRMEVADDMKLGMVLRRSGARQGAAALAGAVSVRWQQGFLATVEGLFKNAFSGMEWRWSLNFLSIFGILIISVAPLAVLFLAPSRGIRVLSFFAMALPMLLHGLTARRCFKKGGLEGLTYPLMALIFSGIMFWSALAATLRRGIVWRGTFYPLDLLKKGCVRESDWPLNRVIGWDETA